MKKEVLGEIACVVAGICGVLGAILKFAFKDEFAANDFERGMKAYAKREERRKLEQQKKEEEKES